MTGCRDLWRPRQIRGRRETFRCLTQRLKKPTPGGKHSLLILNHSPNGLIQSIDIHPPSWGLQSLSVPWGLTTAPVHTEGRPCLQKGPYRLLVLPPRGSTRRRTRMDRRLGNNCGRSGLKGENPDQNPDKAQKHFPSVTWTETLSLPRRTTVLPQKTLGKRNLNRKPEPLNPGKLKNFYFQETITDIRESREPHDPTLTSISLLFDLRIRDPKESFEKRHPYPSTVEICKSNFEFRTH